MTSSSNSWNFEEEEDGPCFSSYDSNFMAGGLNVCGAAAEQGSTSNKARSNAITHFKGMGFREDVVIRIVDEYDEYGEENIQAILDTLLHHKELEECAPQEEFSDFEAKEESNLHIKENLEPLSEMEKIQSLREMGFPEYQILRAITSYPDSPIEDLMDYISASQMGETTSDNSCELSPESEGHGSPDVKQKRIVERDKRKRKLSVEPSIKVPTVMIGFGVPNHPRFGFKRSIPDEAIPLPYFYFENVARATKCTWDIISRELFNIVPEFVDSKYFCASARKRGYVHNLPTENRYPLLPIPPLTIQEVFPLTSRFWPYWDNRTQLNCIRTRGGSSKLVEKLSLKVQEWQGDPPESIQKQVLEECRTWNLVWTGKYRVSNLLAEEVENILGYPTGHTRGWGRPAAERFEALGNSFQVNTIAYHLSVLRPLFPQGIRVLSLFSGIGGAEIALNNLGIPLSLVVAVETSEINRDILRSWWENTGQTGTLVDTFTDVQKLGENEIETLVKFSGGFDLVIGGSPCNNLTGSNRTTRHGLDGSDSVLFFDYARILKIVMRRMRENI